MSGDRQQPEWIGKAATLASVCLWAGLAISYAQSPQQQPLEPQSVQQQAKGLMGISGVVLDPSGGVVADAVVTLRSMQDASERAASTDAAGAFRFDGVAAGAYEILVQEAGFKPFRTRVRMRPRRPAPVRIALAIAELQQEITVSGTDGQANTETADNLNVVRLDAEQLEELPVLENDVVAAVSPLLDTASLGTSGASLVVDGMPSSSIGVPTSAIQEVRINQNPYSAEFARPGPGRIEIITRGGSTQYHGAVNFLLRDYHLDARNAFAAERPVEQRRVFDGYLSGPVAHSKKTTFVFGFYQDSDDTESAVYAYTASGILRQNFPTPARNTLVSFRLNRQASKGSSMSLQYSYFDWSAIGGVGGFNLPDVGWNASARRQTLQYAYHAVATSSLINELSVRASRADGLTESERPGTSEIVVLDSFNGGGGQIHTSKTDSDLELRDVLSWARGRHLVRAGVSNLAIGRQGLDDRSNFDGTFYFSSLADYSQDRPFSFVQQQGNPLLAFWHAQAGFFAQDDIRILPNLSLAFGLRYDWQNYLSNFSNLAPRFALAFSPGLSRKTVLRAGAGIFYDALPPAAIADALRFNGSWLRQIVLENPGYPDPAGGSGAASVEPSSLVRFAPDLQSPYTLQLSLSAERQLRKSAILTVTFTETRGVKLFRSRDLNAPPPPQYEQRPDPAISVSREIESSGGLEAHSLRLSFRGNATRFFNGMVLYTLSRAYNDTSGINSFPADQYNLSGEWSRADFDVRHYVYLYGTINASKYFDLGVVFSAASGRPYTLITGQDNNHDGRATDRPSGVPRNSLEGPGSANLDLRWSKEFPRRRSRKEQGPSVTLSLDAFNVLNRVNDSAMIGNLSSPFFGRVVAALPARRIQVSLRLKF